MSKTFVIPDLHGRYDLLDLALNEIQLASHSGGTIIFLGDYVDRGFESHRIIDRLMKGVNPPWKLIPLMGNHESMMIEACSSKDQFLIEGWINNGGATTLLGYGQAYGQAPDVTVVPEDHIEFLKTKLFPHYEDKHRFYVHAGFYSSEDPDDVPLEYKLWFRYPNDWTDNPVKGKHVVHGHTPRPEPELFNNRTNLDTGAYHTGKLVIGVFDDDIAGGPVSFLHIKGPDYSSLVASYKKANGIPS